MSIATERDIRDAYAGKEVATRYVDERFASELHRLMHQLQVSTLQRLISSTGANRVLEIAPGPGRLTRELCKTGAVVCLEYNEGMIEQGRLACTDQATWVRGNAFTLPFDRTFDLVYSFRFVRHFHKSDRERLYTQIRRVLNPGGHFVMDAVNESISRPLREAQPEDYPIYDKLYRPEELRAELAAAGLSVVRMEAVQKSYRWQYRSQVHLGPRANWLNRLVIRTLERLSWRDGLEWIVTCRRA